MNDSPQPTQPPPHYTGAYTEAVAAAAAQHDDFVMGFISISPAQWSGPAPSPGLIHMTPGVQLQVGALPSVPHASGGGSDTANTWLPSAS